ncbi:MAG: tetratricopeptide repeat protein [Bryobacterales bacterium]|nr:tetratricopeptide repeat protein [Bryobacterales bacterium]
MTRFGCFLLVLFVALATPLPAQRSALERSSASAKKLLEQGKFEEAIPFLLELRKAAPNDNGLGMNLGTAYASTGNFAAAAREFESIRQRNPAFGPATLSLAGIYLNQGRAREAVDLLSEQVAREPSNGEARNMLASVYRATGDLARANEQLNELARLAPRNARAQHLLFQSYQEIAQQSFALTEEAAPESAYMVALAGYERLAKEEYASAFFLMREALRRQPALRGPHAALATIYGKTAHPEWASAENARHAAQAAPDCATEPLACAFAKDDFTVVMQATRFARLPEDLYWRYRASSALAERAFTRLQALPKSVHALGAKAERLRGLGRHQDAVAVWKQAIALAPGNPGLEKELVVSLYQAKEYAACARAADALLKTNPGDGHVLLLRGDAALSQQDAAAALPYLERSVAMNPAMLPAQASLGRALLQLGRAADALPHLELALPYDQDGSILYQLSQAYQQTGKTEEAKRMLVRYQTFLKRDQAEKAEFEAKFKIVAP